MLVLALHGQITAINVENPIKRRLEREKRQRERKRLQITLKFNLRPLFFDVSLHRFARTLNLMHVTKCTHSRPEEANKRRQAQAFENVTVAVLREKVDCNAATANNEFI